MKKFFKPKNNRTYIIPSKQGLRFLFVIVMLLLIGLVYNNNVVLGLCFLLASWFIIVMHLSNENIRSIQIHKVNLNSGFANQEAELDISLVTNPWVDQRYDVEISNHGFHRSFQLPSSSNEHLKVSTSSLALSRGVHEKPRLKLSSTFPFGLFTAWKNYVSNDPWVIAPERKISSELRNNLLAEDHREFESFQLQKFKKPGQVIDWKMTSSREELDQLVLRDFQNPLSRAHIFSWYQMPGNPEEKLSSISYLVHQTFLKGEAFQVELPNFKSDLSASNTNYQRCLYELAQFKG